MRKERWRRGQGGIYTYWQDAHSGVKITRGSRKTFICKSKHSSLFIECQREYLRPIFVSSGAEGTDGACARAWKEKRRKKHANRAQQKHNFPRWRREGCSRNEWSFSSIPSVLYSSSDRMFVFRKIDRNETGVHASALTLVEATPANPPLL